MNLKKRRRLAFAAAIVLAAAGTAALMLFAIRDNVDYFRSPSDVAAKTVPAGVNFRLGGLVEANSVKQGNSAEISFVVTDGKFGVPVQFRGVLPALFREGQGVIAAGQLSPAGVFVANNILAKHDEKYMPPEVVESLKRSGRWKEGE
jgi:cytochrome c-type biogenesis protein CcmE